MTIENQDRTTKPDRFLIADERKKIADNLIKQSLQKFTVNEGIKNALARKVFTEHEGIPEGFLVLDFISGSSKYSLKVDSSRARGDFSIQIKKYLSNGYEQVEMSSHRRTDVSKENGNGWIRYDSRLGGKSHSIENTSKALAKVQKFINEL